MKVKRFEEAEECGSQRRIRLGPIGVRTRDVVLGRLADDGVTVPTIDRVVCHSKSFTFHGTTWLELGSLVAAEDNQTSLSWHRHWQHFPHLSGNLYIRFHMKTSISPLVLISPGFL